MNFRTLHICAAAVLLLAPQAATSQTAPYTMSLMNRPCFENNGNVTVKYKVQNGGSGRVDLTVEFTFSNPGIPSRVFGRNVTLQAPYASAILTNTYTVPLTGMTGGKLDLNYAVYDPSTAPAGGYDADTSLRRCLQQKSGATLTPLLK